MGQSRSASSSTLNASTASAFRWGERRHGVYSESLKRRAHTQYLRQTGGLAGIALSGRQQMWQSGSVLLAHTSARDVSSGSHRPPTSSIVSPFANISVCHVVSPDDISSGATSRHTLYTPVAVPRIVDLGITQSPPLWVYVSINRIVEGHGPCPSAGD